MRFRRRSAPDQPLAGSDGDDNQYALRRQPQPSVRAKGEQEGGSPPARHDRRGSCHAGECRRCVFGLVLTHHRHNPTRGGRNGPNASGAK